MGPVLRQFTKMFIIILSCLFTVWLQGVGAECPAIITKKEWDGEKPTHIQYLRTPLDLVIIQHTITQSCNNDQNCLTIVKDIQRIHKNESFLWDIGPSFLIANTGKIYEGRGWNYVAVHTFGYNNQSLGIAFIGNFNNQEPSQKALDSARALIQCGVDLERLAANYKVVVQSQLVPTESPGAKLASKVMSWLDWTQDVTEIIKRADTKEFNHLPNTLETEDDTIQSRDAWDPASNEKPTSKREILTTPKEIDLLSNSRDIIRELIDNLYKLARQILDTLQALRQGLNRQLVLFLERLTNNLRVQKDRINAAVSATSLIPGLSRCVTPIKDRANALYDDDELKIKTCANQRVSEVSNMINNLGTLSSNAIDFSNIAVQDTKNCTELNFAIEPVTKACLNSVTRQIQSATRNYESQKTLALQSIKTALEALPAALNLCNKNLILEGHISTTHMVSQIGKCSRPFGLF